MSSFSTWGKCYHTFRLHLICLSLFSLTWFLHQTNRGARNAFEQIFVIALGRLTVYQFIPSRSSPFERSRAMQIVNEDLKEEREELELTVIDEEEELLALEVLWETLGGEAPVKLPQSEDSRSVSLNDDIDFTQPKKLFKISDENGVLSLKLVKEEEELGTGDVTADDVWAVAVDGRASFISVHPRARQRRLRSECMQTPFSRLWACPSSRRPRSSPPSVNALRGIQSSRNNCFALANAARLERSSMHFCSAQ